ncbi:hypothetical protein D7X94_04160 [Acutalibacter sp. 1XD8-33]|nr:hypothetical protein D7X94_04160 [Acutalibacter sp. 1XD8-33]
MTDLERKLYKFLLMIDAIAIVISMIAGPLRHTAISIGAAASAALISLSLILYGLYFWAKR